MPCRSPILHAESLSGPRPLPGIPFLEPKRPRATKELTLDQMVFLGANDSVFPNTSGQDVPLHRYCANLKSIIQHHKIQALSTNKHGKPATKIILVTPPPVDEYQLRGFPLLDVRSAERTKSYADACAEVGKELGVAVLHLWEIMMKKAGWEGKEGEILVGSKKREKSQALEEMLVDGESFSSVNQTRRRDRP